MPRDEQALAFFADLAERAGTPPLDADEVRAVLALAKVAAHNHERRFAPLTAYAAGLTLRADQPGAERRARIEALIELLGGTDG